MVILLDTFFVFQQNFGFLPTVTISHVPPGWLRTPFPNMHLPGLISPCICTSCSNTHLSHTHTTLWAKSCCALLWTFPSFFPCIYLLVVTLSVPDLLPGSCILFVCCLPWYPACLLTTILPDLLCYVCWCMTLAWLLLCLIKTSCTCI